MSAVKGKQAVERSEVVYVNEPPAGTVSAILSVTDQATRVEAVETPVTVAEAFPPQSKEAVHRIDRQIPARHGFAISAARLQQAPDRGVRNLRVEVASDRRSARLTGELVNETGGVLSKGAAPSLVAQVLLTQERRSPVTRPAVPVSATLAVPGTALLALPSLPGDWVDPQRQVRLELREGDRVVWQESQLPRAAAVTVHNRRYNLTAVSLGSQIRVELVENSPETSRTGTE
jgi:hypothetical protein